jgi:ADP-heptose:LPS heptosyltransferase
VEENCTIPPPINFNCWKHHTGFIKKQIQSVQKRADLEKLKSYLLKIGESQMDLYYGKYSPNEIAEQIAQQLKKKNILSDEIYNLWLNEKGRDYQLITLPDNSFWTLRKGNDSRRYIHIHPGRHSTHTRRVKAPTLKTVILTLCYEKTGETQPEPKELINKIRKEYLNEPPLKTIYSESGLGKLFNLLRT